MWKVVAPPMYTVSAAFSTFDVENGPSCSYDCVEVMNVDTLGSILRCVTLSNHSGVKATKNKYLFCNKYFLLHTT